MVSIVLQAQHSQNHFTTKPRWQVVTSFHLDLPLTSFFFLASINSLSLRLCCKNVVSLALLILCLDPCHILLLTYFKAKLIIRFIMRSLRLIRSTPISCKCEKKRTIWWHRKLVKQTSFTGKTWEDLSY